MGLNAHRNLIQFIRDEQKEREVHPLSLSCCPPSHPPTPPPTHPPSSGTLEWRIAKPSRGVRGIAAEIKSVNCLWLKPDFDLKAIYIITDW